MDVWYLAKVLFRRWYVALPMIVVTVWACSWLRTTVQPDFTATTHVQLLPPQKTTVGTTVRDPVNPYLDLGLGSLSELARVSLEGQSIARRLQAAGLSQTFTVTVDQFSPLVSIEAVGNTEAQATGTAGQLAVLFMQSVADFQKNQGVGPKDLILTQRIPAGDKIETSTADVKRAVTVAGAGGLLLTVGLTVGFEAAVNRLRRRRPAVRATSRMGTPSQPAVDEPSLPVRQRGGSRSIGRIGPGIGPGIGQAVGGDSVAGRGFGATGGSRPTGRASVVRVEAGPPALPSGFASGLASGLSVTYQAGSIGTSEIGGPADAGGYGEASGYGDASGFGGTTAPGGPAGPGPADLGPSQPPDWLGSVRSASPVPASPTPASPVPASPVPASPVPASPVPAANLPAPYQGFSQLPDRVTDPDADGGAAEELPFDATVLLPLSFKGPSGRDGRPR